MESCTLGVLILLNVPRKCETSNKKNPVVPARNEDHVIPVVFRVRLYLSCVAAGWGLNKERHGHKTRVDGDCRRGKSAVDVTGQGARGVPWNNNTFDRCRSVRLTEASLAAWTFG